MYVVYFTGNGYIGISLDGSHGVWLKGVRGLDIATDYNPLVHFSIRGYDVRGGLLCEFTEMVAQLPASR